MEKEKIILIIKEKISEIINIPVEDIDEEENFMKLGINSIEAMDIISSLGEELDIEISPVAIFEYKTIEMFADYIANGGEDNEDDWLLHESRKKDW